MRTFLVALAVSLLAASLALADTATIKQDQGGVSISICGSPKKKPAASAEAATAPQAPEAAPGQAAIPGELPPGMEKMLNPEQLARAKVIAEVMIDYSSKSHYSEFSETRCKQMSEAVWFRLTKRGVPARIAGGNVHTQCTRGGFANYMSLADHAWVVAALSPGYWIALETTSGAIVSQKENPLYYTSAIYFDRPEDMYRFDGLRRTFVETHNKVAAMRDKWNEDAKGKRFTKGSELYQELQRRAQEIDKLDQENADRLRTLERIFMNGIFLH